MYFSPTDIFSDKYKYFYILGFLGQTIHNVIHFILFSHESECKLA